eukprot:c14560_g1_i1 orf=255-1445(+)
MLQQEENLLKGDPHMDLEILQKDKGLSSLAMADTTSAVDVGTQHRRMPSPTPDALDSLAHIRSLEALQDHHDAVLSRHSARFGTMGALDVLRESITVLRANSSTLMSLMFLLICPVSGLFLSRVLLHGDLANKLATRLYAAASSVGLLHYLSLVKSIYKSLSQALLSYILLAPVLFTVWLLAKASIIYIVSCTYADKEVSLFTSITAGVRLWKRVFCTYLWSSIILVGFGAMAVVVFMVIVGLLDALQFSADLIFLTELALGIFYSVIFAQILVVANLANVVSILEENYGCVALARSFHLIKGKIQVALSLFCGTLLGTVMVETLYQYRVIGIPPSNYTINMASRMWEGPLLVFMYSFLLLLDGIMGCVFYFTCKSSTFGFPENQHLMDSKSFADV